MREVIVQDPSSRANELFAELDLGGRVWTDNASEFIQQAPKIHRWLVEILDQGRWPSFVQGDITSVPSAWRAQYREYLSLVFTPEGTPGRFAVRFYYSRSIGDVKYLAQDFHCSPKDIYDFQDDVGGITINDEDVSVSCSRSFGIGSFVEFHNEVRDNVIGCVDAMEASVDMLESYCRGDRGDPKVRSPRPRLGRRRKRGEVL